MVHETTKPTHLPTEGDQKHKHKQFDREVRDMVHAITDRITDLHKPGSSQHHEDDDDDHGLRIITLAGTNTGATMRTQLDDKNSPLVGGSLDDDHRHQQQPEPLATYVNSNFQAVNNSIMLGSGYSTNDPGVHLDISDVYEHHHDHKAEKHAKRGKKKDKESLKSDLSN